MKMAHLTVKRRIPLQILRQKSKCRATVTREEEARGGGPCITSDHPTHSRRQASLSLFLFFCYHRLRFHHIIYKGTLHPSIDCGSAFFFSPSSFLSSTIAAEAAARNNINHDDRGVLLQHHNYHQHHHHHDDNDDDYSWMVRCDLINIICSRRRRRCRCGVRQPHLSTQIIWLFRGALNLCWSCTYNQVSHIIINYSYLFRDTDAVVVGLAQLWLPYHTLRQQWRTS